jgi:hypothetical protein
LEAVGDDHHRNCAFAIAGAALEYYFGHGKNTRVSSGVTLDVVARMSGC